MLRSLSRAVLRSSKAPATIRPAQRFVGDTRAPIERQTPFVFDTAEGPESTKEINADWRTARMAHGRSSTVTNEAGDRISTGITGLPIVPNWREVLIDRYELAIEQATLYGLDVPFNAHVVKFSQFRLNCVQSTNDWERIEAMIDGGQIEELIEQAETELGLLYRFNEVYKMGRKEMPADELAQWDIIKNEMYPGWPKDPNDPTIIKPNAEWPITGRTTPLPPTFSGNAPTGFSGFGPSSEIGLVSRSAPQLVIQYNPQL